MSGLLVLTLLGAIAGCGAPVITAEDVVVIQRRTARFMVSIDREYLKPSVGGADVSFFVNGELIGRATGDADGTAVAYAHIDDGAASYQARSTIDGHSVKGDGRVFHWDTSRTAVAVDVDDTISRTDYGDLFLSRFDITSTPLDYSPQALRVIARNYHIVYVSVRPRWLHEKTKVWLDRNGFPRGPVLHAPGFYACLDQAFYKMKMLTEFQRQFPNLLGGVGDKLEDEKAYGDRRMLAVILGRSDEGYRNHCVIVPDWHAVGRFFDEHKDSLADANRLSRLIQANGMNLRPLFANGNIPVLAAAARAGRSDAVGAAATASPPPIRSAQSTPTGADRMSAISGQADRGTGLGSVRRRSLGD